MSFDIEELTEARFGSRFFSRKNTIFKSVLNAKTVVVKIYPPEAIGAAHREFSVLELCQGRGIAAPRPLGFDESTIVMEYVNGPTLAEFLDTTWLSDNAVTPPDGIGIDAVAAMLGDWLARFHIAFESRIYRGDANIRNFIIDGSRLVGVDFEESDRGDIMTDLGQACSSVLSMDPMFTAEKRDFCRSMAEAYFSSIGSTKVNELNDATARALEHYASFRHDGRLLIEKAIEVRNAGIWSSEE